METFGSSRLWWHSFCICPTFHYGFHRETVPIRFLSMRFPEMQGVDCTSPVCQAIDATTYSKLMQPNTQGYYSQKKVAWMCSMLKCLHSRKLAWQRKIVIFNRKYMFKWWIFHDHVSFRGNEFSCGFKYNPQVQPPLSWRDRRSQLSQFSLKIPHFSGN